MRRATTRDRPRPGSRRRGRAGRRSRASTQPCVRRGRSRSPMCCGTGASSSSGRRRRPRMCGSARQGTTGSWRSMRSRRSSRSTGARVDRALRSPSAAHHAGARDRRRHGTARPRGRAAARAAPGGRSVSLVILASETYAGRAARPAATCRACARPAQGVLVAVVTAETPIADALAGRSAGAASG